MARKNDITLALGSVLLCASAMTSGVIGGVYIRAWQEAQMSAGMVGTAPSCGCAAAAAGEAVATDATQQAVLSAVGVLTIAAIAVIIGIVFGLYNRKYVTNLDEVKQVENEQAQKGKYATGVSLPWAVGLTIGGTLLAGTGGLVIGAYVEQASYAQVEILGIAGGVLAGLAAVAFVTDYVVNR